MSDDEKWCDCSQADKCVRDRCAKCCYCGMPRPKTDETAPLNFDEARELAEMKQKESNLARCYLALAQRLEKATSPVDVPNAIKAGVIQLANKYASAPIAQPFLARAVMEILFEALRAQIAKLAVDLPCPECGKMMTNHVVMTRHETGACDESFAGPPLTEYLMPTKDNAFYSEHVLGMAPDGTPTPQLLRPELRKAMFEDDHPANVMSDRLMASAWLDGPIGESQLAEARQSLAKLLTDTRVFERARLAEPKTAKKRHNDPGDRQKLVDEIGDWLLGLERARESVAAQGTDPREVAVMEARRGIYEGIAGDIRRKWGT